MVPVKKEWADHRAQSSWLMFKIMAEFVDGFERMEQIGPCISIFGSARTKPGTPYYETAVKIAERLGHEGYGIISGGGPGIMEAANKGAQLAGMPSVGLNIELPHEQGFNQYIDLDKVFNFKYFFVRKVMFLKYSQAVVLMPGGFGTMDEMFETITLVQTGKIDKIPIVLYGSSYWSGLLKWIKETMLETEHNISPSDIDLLHVTDDVEDIVKIIDDHYLRSSIMPNF